MLVIIPCNKAVIEHVCLQTQAAILSIGKEFRSLTHSTTHIEYASVIMTSYRMSAEEGKDVNTARSAHDVFSTGVQNNSVVRKV
jgi:hypothetical protein